MAKVKKDQKIVIVAAISAVLLLTSLGYAGMQIFGPGNGIFGGGAGNGSYSGNVPPVDRKQDHIFGNPKAEISLIEYSDYQCPFCAKFHPTGKQIIEAYEGKVNWVFRHFPLSFHEPEATKKAIAAECIADIEGNETFWKFTELAYEGLGSKSIEDLVKELDVDEEKFLKCQESGKFKGRVEKDLADVKKLPEVEGTPGNIIFNNKTGEYKVLSGAYPFADFKAIIDKMLYADLAD